MALAPRVQRMKAIGKSLELYLQKVRDHNVLMERERAEFERGKRHLANIMGWDPQMKVEQQDIDRAIEYLFPSGLGPMSRPVMKPPEQIHPTFNRFQFDAEGRPSDPLFFTLKPKFYALLSDIGLKTQRLTNYHDERLLRNLPLSDNKGLLNLAGSAWIQKDNLSKKLNEKLSEDMYANLIMAFDYLAHLPCAHLEAGFIMEYRTLFTSGERSDLFGPPVPEPQLDVEKNVRFAEVRTRVKRTVVNVKTSDAGVGHFSFNGLPLSAFQSLMARENIMIPLIIAEKLGKVDVEANLVEGPGGLAVIPRAIRHGIALGLASLYPESKNELRLGRNNIAMMSLTPYSWFTDTRSQEKRTQQGQSAWCSCKMDLETSLIRQY